MTPLLTAGEAPPSNYYARILKTLVESVVTQYDDLLSEDEAEVAHVVLTLPSDSLRLLARLISRTRPILRLDSLNYEEVTNLDLALETLQSSGLIALNPRLEVGDALGLLTKPELVEKFPACSQHRSKKKAEFVTQVQETYEEDVVLSTVTADPGWLYLEIEEQLYTFNLLFFGNVHQSMSEFILRDLGVTQFENYQLDKEVRFFETRDALDRYIELDELAWLVDSVGKEINVELADMVFDRVKDAETDRLLERRRSQVLNQLARNLERLEELDLATQLYRHSSLHPARERTMRILHKTMQLDQLEDVRREILLSPRSLEEQQFAQSFQIKNQVKQHLPLETFTLTQTPNIAIEEFAIQQLVYQDWFALHLENHLPNLFFGLAYWDWIFAPVRGAFVNPFQISPIDLYWPEFFDVRKDLCTDPLNKPETLKEHILSVAVQKRGISNSFVAWSMITTELLSSLLDSLSVNQLASLLQIMRSDLRQFRSGFPDLIVIDQNQSIRLIEVKGPGDQVRPNQRLWIERLVEADIPVSVWMYRLK